MEESALYENGQVRVLESGDKEDVDIFSLTNTEKESYTNLFSSVIVSYVNVIKSEGIGEGNLAALPRHSDSTNFILYFLFCQLRCIW